MIWNIDVDRNAQNTVSPLASMEMGDFEQTLSLQKDGDEGFVKIPILSTFAKKVMKTNEIHQQSILIYFMAIFNVM